MESGDWSLTYINSRLVVLESRDAPIIGIGRLSAVLPCQINILRPSSHPGNRRPSICRIFARNHHSIDPAHAAYDIHPRRCMSHSMRRADPAKGSVRKCDRSKVAGCLGCELGLKELKPRQLYERVLRQSINRPLCLIV